MESSDARRLNELAVALTTRAAFAGTVLVARRGVVLLNRGYGLANRKPQVRNGPATRFRLNSLVRAILVAATLRLHDRGRLRLDAHVCVLLSSCKGLSPDTSVRGLLIEPPRSGAAGSDRLLAALLERVTGKPWQEALRKDVFARIGVRLPRDATRPVSTRGYTLDARGRAVPARLAAPDRGDPESLRLTTGDFYRFVRALRSPGLLSRESLQLLNGGPSEAWSCCWFSTRRWGRPLQVHGGHAARPDGWYTLAARYPRDDLTILVFSNFNGSDVVDLELDLARMALQLPFIPPARTPRPIPTPRETLAADAGVYTGLRNVRIADEGNVLLMSPSLSSIAGVGADRLVPIGDGRFANARNPDMIVTFVKGSDGTVHDLRISNKRPRIFWTLKRRAGS
jgi:CubicO group peptidase (beta-lactamase class C family)